MTGPRERDDPASIPKETPGMGSGWGETMSKKEWCKKECTVIGRRCLHKIPPHKKKQYEGLSPEWKGYPIGDGACLESSWL